MGLFDNVFKEVGKVLDKAAGNQEHQRCIDIPTEKRMNHKKPSL